jgi:hypothetical protein
MQDATPFLPGLSPVARKSLTATQDAGNLTSNGGLVVLREAARRLDLAAVIADPLRARSHPPQRVQKRPDHLSRQSGRRRASIADRLHIQ